TYDALKGYLETELDRAAAAKPNPGKLPLLHRLTRTEYQNAIRDLLAIDALPKEMDYSLLLPQDNAMSGFDNIADLLFVSPPAMRTTNRSSRLPSMANACGLKRCPLRAAEAAGEAAGVRVEGAVRRPPAARQPYKARPLQLQLMTMLIQVMAAAAGHPSMCEF